MSSFAHILREHAAQRPHAPALTFEHETQSFAQLHARSSRAAHALRSAGVRPGDRVALLTKNRAECFELMFACSKIGAILVGLNWRLASREIAEIVADATPRIVPTGADVVGIETAGGKDYAGFVAAAAERLGGSASAVTMKVTAVDMTPQVQEIMAQKPDLITIYRVQNTAILTMKALAQYGVKIPAFAITYLGTPSVYEALGPEAGADYTFISCFTPGGADPAPGNVAMSAYAEKAGHAALKANINYVSGWVAGEMAAQALTKAGSEPTRQKLVDALAPGFTLDTQGLSAPIVYIKDDHTGPKVLKMIGYDYGAGKFKAFGDYADFAKYTK